MENVGIEIDSAGKIVTDSKFKTNAENIYAIGDVINGPMFNRNKRSISIDLKSKEGNKIAIDIIKNADVVIENFRPGAMDRLGFGYEEIKKINTKIIY